MKKIILFFITLVFFYSIYSINQSEVSIDYDRLPWTGTNPDSLEWERAGCLAGIEDNGGLEIDNVIDVTKDLDNLFFDFRRKWTI